MSEWKSWESRWAEYLDGLAAAEGQPESDEESGPLPPSNLGGSRLPPSNLGGGGSSSDEEPEVAPPADAAPPSPAAAPSKAATTAPLGGSAASGVSAPQLQPERPRPPGWEAKQAEREAWEAEAARKYKERQAQIEEQERLKQEKRRQLWEEKQEQERVRERLERERRQESASRRQQFRRPSGSGSARRPPGDFGVPPPPRPPPPPPPPPGATPSGAAAVPSKPKAPPALGRFFDTFAAFDAAYTEWEATAASAELIRLADVPFPPKRDPAGLLEAGLLHGGADASQRKKRLRTALLRWHPDKWMALTSKMRKHEHVELGKRLAVITQALVEQKDL